ncbi:MAG: M3 family oligoendopeptidase [Eubacteriales bacterium]|nr:M3 family oligoendopeptidase [Eubacteriales bacterium]
MKFSEMKYERPNFLELFDEMKGLLAKMREAEDQDSFFSAILELDDLSGKLQTQGTLAYVRHSIDTTDEFYDKEREVFDEESPRFGEIGSELATIVLESPHRKAFADKWGKHMLEKFELQQKTFKPEIIEDLVLENKLSSSYDKLIASAEIEFQGEKYNLSGLAPFAQNKDREVRKAASFALNNWLAEREGELDQIYADLVEVRDRIAKKLGFESFIPLAYARMGRTDWTAADAKVYRKQIAEHVVPLTQKLIAEQQERLGLSEMKFYDYSLSFLSGNPKPLGEEEYLVASASEMYNELSPQTAEFFQTMTSQELMDLTTKPGKSGGGYMTFIHDYKVPFIFSNFNGTSGDVDVLTHEAGHAFQGWLQRNTRPSFLADFTMEVAETHSMAMEFFTHPWMEKFFGEDCEKYYYSHVADALRFLPYGASIDEFQEWVFENVEASPEERRAAYRRIEEKYLPHLKYEDCPYLANGGRWQRQAHVYAMPFYYLDYTISQVCAFQYFLWDLKDHEAAWQSYLKNCERAGRVPFTELVAECGLKNPFKEGCIASITPGLEEYLDSLDKSKIK